MLLEHLVSPLLKKRKIFKVELTETELRHKNIAECLYHIWDGEKMPEITESFSYAYYDEFKLKFPFGYDPESVKKILSQVSHHINRRSSIRTNGKEWFVRVYHNDLKDTYPYKKIVFPKDGCLYFAFGNSILGPTMLNMTKEDVHLAVIASTGAGKGYLGRSALYNCMQNYTEEELHVYFSDNLNADVNQVKDFKHVKKIATSGMGTLNMLKEIVSEMERRQREIVRTYYVENGIKYACENAHEYNKYSKEKMPHILFFIDEPLFGIAQIEQKSENPKEDVAEFNKLWGAIASAGRKSAIHMCCFSQRLTMDVVPRMVFINSTKILVD